MMNSTQDIAQAMERAVTVLTRRPDVGVHADASARACWRGGTRVSAHHAAGTRMDTDMPTELGGSGDCVTAGWLFRAGIAACTTTVIGMIAASEGLVLDELEVTVGSESDARGMLGMCEPDGTPVPAGPLGLAMAVRIRAAGVDEARLRQLVDAGVRRSPMLDALRRPAPVTVAVQVDAARAC